MTALGSFRVERGDGPPRLHRGDGEAGRRTRSNSLPRRGPYGLGPTSIHPRVIELTALRRRASSTRTGLLPRRVILPPDQRFREPRNAMNVFGKQALSRSRWRFTSQDSYSLA